MRSRCFNEAAIAGRWCTGVQRASQVHRASFHATHQRDDAVLIQHAVSFNVTCVVDHASE